MSVPLSRRTLSLDQIYSAKTKAADRATFKDMRTKVEEAVKNGFKDGYDITGRIRISYKNTIVKVIANDDSVTIRRSKKDSNGFDGIIISKTQSKDLKELSDRTHQLHNLI